MNLLKLHMLLLGCKPAGRNTEQHDIFFGIASSLAELITEIESFWPEAQSKIDVDDIYEIEDELYIGYLKLSKL